MAVLRELNTLALSPAARLKAETALPPRFIASSNPVVTAFITMLTVAVCAMTFYQLLGCYQEEAPAVIPDACMACLNEPANTGGKVSCRDCIIVVISPSSFTRRARSKKD